MSPSSTKTEYTIRSANQTLPLVRMIVEDIVEYSREISETRERLEYLSDGRELSRSNDEYSKELHSIETVTDQKSAEVENCLRELSELNIATQNAIHGFVDFPAIREDEPVHLCWHHGEKEVLFWHQLDEDCSCRQPIDLSLIRKSGDTSVSTN